MESLLDARISMSVKDSPLRLACLAGLETRARANVVSVIMVRNVWRVLGLRAPENA